MIAAMVGFSHREATLNQDGPYMCVWAVDMCLTAG